MAQVNQLRDCFNLEPLSPEILILQQLRKTVPKSQSRPKKPAKLPICWTVWYLLTSFLILHQLLELWRLLICSILATLHKKKDPDALEPAAVW